RAGDGRGAGRPPRIARAGESGERAAALRPERLPACWRRSKSMRFPIHTATDMISWQLRNWWRGNARSPSVLMLEPLHTCNLACIGCSPERYNGDLKDRLSLADCLEAVDQAGAPVVSICGGEPTIYPELPELVDAIIA